MLDLLARKDEANDKHIVDHKKVMELDFSIQWTKKHETHLKKLGTNTPDSTIRIRQENKNSNRKTTEQPKPTATDHLQSKHK